MADELEINKGGVVSLIDNHELGEILKPLVREIYLFNSYVAGTTHLDQFPCDGRIGCIPDDLGSGTRRYPFYMPWNTDCIRHICCFQS